MSRAASPSDQPVEVDFDAIRLYPGAEMQVQSLADVAQVRHKVRFIGFIKDKSLLVTLPLKNGERMWMEEGQTFIVRGFNGKYAYAFTTPVIRARAHPFPYLHFAWPLEVECQLVRNALRVAVSLPAAISQAGGQPVTVTILDLSASGALIDSPVEAGAAGDHVQLDFAVDFEGDAMKLGIPSAVIRKIYQKESEAGYRIGLGFEHISQNDSLILHYFINTIGRGE